MSSKLFLIFLSFYLISCGGGGSSSTSQNTSPTPAPTPVPTVEPLLLLDNFEALDEAEELVEVYVASSTVNGVQHAVGFSVSSPVTVTRVSWVGTASIQAGSEPTESTMQLRVMAADADGKPDTSTAIDISASSTAVFTAVFVGQASIFTFTVEDSALFELDEGDYFISVLDPETEAAEFRWAERTEDPSVIAAFRTDPDAGWILWESPRNIMIEGILR